MRRTRARIAPSPAITTTWTLGNFLKAATKVLSAALPCPGRRPRRQTLSSPRRGRSDKCEAATTAAPPTAERRAQVHLLRTIGIICVNQVITAVEMRA
jgi:hypothetical protein